MAIIIRTLGCAFWSFLHSRRFVDRPGTERRRIQALLPEDSAPSEEEKARWSRLLPAIGISFAALQWERTMEVTVGRFSTAKYRDMKWSVCSRTALSSRALAASKSSPAAPEWRTIDNITAQWSISWDIISCVDIDRLDRYLVIQSSSLRSAVIWAFVFRFLSQ